MDPGERETDAFQDMTERVCSSFLDEFVRVPEPIKGLLLLSSGGESMWCKEPNTGIRSVAYQRNSIPIL